MLSPLNQGPFCRDGLRMVLTDLFPCRVQNIMDVLEQVSTLFADHPDLLKEFTYFLPDAVQEQAKERLNRAARESEIRKAVSPLLRSNGDAWWCS
jgi:hypothetical protein